MSVPAEGLSRPANPIQTALSEARAVRARQAAEEGRRLAIKPLLDALNSAGMRPVEMAHDMDAWLRERSRRLVEAGRLLKQHGLSGEILGRLCDTSDAVFRRAGGAAEALLAAATEIDEIALLPVVRELFGSFESNPEREAADSQLRNLCQAICIRVEDLSRLAEDRTSTGKPAAEDDVCGPDAPGRPRGSLHKTTRLVNSYSLVAERTLRREALSELARDPNRERQARYCQGYDPDWWIPALLVAKWRSLWYPAEPTRESVQQWLTLIDALRLEYLGPANAPDQAAKLEENKQNDLNVIRECRPHLVDLSGRTGTSEERPADAALDVATSESVCVQFTLGRLIEELQVHETRRADNERRAQRYSDAGNLSGELFCSQLTSPWQPDPAAMPGIDSFQAAAEALFGPLTHANAIQIRGLIANPNESGVSGANALSLSDAAIRLAGLNRNRERAAEKAPGSAQAQSGPNDLIVPLVPAEERSCRQVVSNLAEPLTLGLLRQVIQECERLMDWEYLNKLRRDRAEVNSLQVYARDQWQYEGLQPAIEAVIGAFRDLSCQTELEAEAVPVSEAVARLRRERATLRTGSKKGESSHAAPLITVEEWSDLAIGIDDKRRYLAISPPPAPGAMIARTEMILLSLNGERWATLLNLAMSAADGRTIRIADLLPLRRIGLGPSNLEIDRRARPGAVQSGQVEGQQLSRKSGGASNWLKDMLGDLRRELRECIQGPKEKKPTILVRAKTTVDMGFVVRCLVVDEGRHVHFGTTPAG